MKHVVLGVATLLLVSTSFAEDRVIKPVVKIVQWGGEGISLQVVHQTFKGEEKISATATVHCGTATIDKVLRDGIGGFLGSGLFYPTPEITAKDSRMAPIPIHAMGYGQGDVMTLIGLKDNDPKSSKVFILKKGDRGSVKPCR